MENLKTGISYKRLAYQKRANSNLNAGRNNFLANKTEACFRIIRVKYYLDNFAQQNYIIVYCSLKNMAHRTGACRYTKCQNLNSFFQKRWMYCKRKAFVEPIWHRSLFFIIERILSETFLKKTISIFSIHLHYLGDPLDK